MSQKAISLPIAVAAQSAEFKGARREGRATKRGRIFRYGSPKLPGPFEARRPGGACGMFSQNSSSPEEAEIAGKPGTAAGAQFSAHLGPMNDPLAFAILYDVFRLGVIGILHRWRIFIKLRDGKSREQPAGAAPLPQCRYPARYAVTFAWLRTAFLHCPPGWQFLSECRLPRCLHTGS